VKKVSHALPLIIAFNGLQIRSQLNFEDTLKRLPVHALFLCDHQCSWYLMPPEDNGFHNVSNHSCGEATVVANVRTIQRVIAGINHTYVATLGISMGGFAALLYGPLVGATHVLAFDTQTFIDKHTRAQLGVNRWAHKITPFHDAFVGHDTKYQNLANVLPGIELEKLPHMTLVAGLKRNEHNWVPQGCTHNLTIDELHVHLLAYSLLRRVGVVDAQLPDRAISSVDVAKVVEQYAQKLNILWVPNAGHNSAYKLKIGIGGVDVSYSDIIDRGLGLTTGVQVLKNE